MCPTKRARLDLSRASGPGKAHGGSGRERCGWELPRPVIGKTISIVDLFACPPAAAAGRHRGVQGCREGSRTTGCAGGRSSSRSGRGRVSGRTARAPNSKHMSEGAPECSPRGPSSSTWVVGPQCLGRGPQRGLVLRNRQAGCFRDPRGFAPRRDWVEGPKGLHTEPQRASFFAAGVLFTGG